MKTSRKTLNETESECIETPLAPHCPYQIHQKQYPIQVPSRFQGWVSWRATSSDLGPTLRRCWLVAPDESWCCPSSSFFSSLCLFCLQLCPQESPFAGCHVSLYGHKISPFVFESSGLVLCSLCLSFVGHVGWLLCQSMVCNWCAYKSTFQKLLSFSLLTLSGSKSRSRIKK